MVAPSVLLISVCDSASGFNSLYSDASGETCKNRILILFPLVVIVATQPLKLRAVGQYHQREPFSVCSDIFIGI